MLPSFLLSFSSPTNSLDSIQFIQALRALIKTSDGDLRRAITYLQSASRLHAATKTPLTAISVQEIGGVVPDHVMKTLSESLGVEYPQEDVEMDEGTGGNKGRKLSGFEGVQKAVEKVCREGYSATQILSQVSLFLSIPFTWHKILIHTFLFLCSFTTFSS